MTGKPGCSNVQELITGNVFWVGDEFFRASTSQSSHRPDNARLQDSSWCSESLGVNEVNQSSYAPWLEVTFGANVIIERLGIGDNYNPLRYIKTFNIYYGNVGETLQPIMDSEGNTNKVRHIVY